jgi:hypothetical protein
MTQLALRLVRRVRGRVQGLKRQAELRRLPYPLGTILSVPGPLHPAECSLLYDLSSHTQTGCIVEIGSYRGKSTVALALGSKDHHSLPVYAIDPHEFFVGYFGGKFGPQDRVVFFETMLRCNTAETVRLINLPSQEVVKGWRKPIGLLWIDGDHRYEAVKEDFERWEPFLVNGGKIAFHDSTKPDAGPTYVVAEAVATGRFELVTQVDLTTVLEKRS